MPEVHEEVINVKLAEILSRELGIDARAERFHGRRRPDIRCYYRGFIIGIEASYNASDAEEDAERRVEEGLVDVALALWIKRRYRDVPEDRLYEEIRGSKFDVKVFVPNEVAGTLIPFIEGRTGRRAEPATGWFRDVDLPTLRVIIEDSIEFLTREEEVARLLEDVRGRVRDFINALSNLDRDGGIRRRIYEVLYRLYGLSVAEAEDPEVAFGHAALSILLSATFYEHVRARHSGLRPLSEYVRDYGPLEGLGRALEDLLRIDYRTAVETTINIVRALPPNAGYRVRDLVDLGIRLASSSGLLRKDFAGRIYHEITGDIALRKGFATFYTEVPAAYLLASLAVQSLLGLDNRDILGLTRDEAREIASRVGSIRVGDLACGSGTLLTASYNALMRIVTMLKYYYDLDDVDLNDVGRRLVEDGIYGIDALKYASQITAINLALIGPEVISRENVYTIYLGYIPNKNQAWLGSLELLNNGKRVGGILAWIEGGTRGTIERVNVEGVEGAFSIPEKFDLIIMNPPFTRPTGRTESFGERRGLFGFIVSEDVRQRFIDDYERVRARVRDELRQIAYASIKAFPQPVQEIISNRELGQYYLNIGQAGEGLPFLYLAYRYIRDNGVIAFVLPKGLLAGISWFLARALLASEFHLKYVIISNDPGGYNFSEGTSLSEVLIIARRVGSHSDDEETVFINLLKKPSSALEAMMLVDSITRAIRSGDAYAGGYGGATAMIMRVRRRELLENVDNWGRLVAFPDNKLNEVILNILREGKLLELGGSAVKVPITKLGSIVDVVGLAVRRGTFHAVFRQVPQRVPGAIPALIGGEEALRRSILTKPNSWVVAARPEYVDTASKFLVPDRIRISTAHATALYSDVPVVANIFFALRPRNNVSEDHLKALTLWLNTVWGILTILSERTETEGAWMSITVTKWRLLPVINVSALGQDTVSKLAMALDRYADKQLRRIPDQFNPDNPDPVRLGIDIDFLSAINPSINPDEARRSLLELYGHVHEALMAWIGSQ